MKFEFPSLWSVVRTTSPYPEPTWWQFVDSAISWSLSGPRAACWHVELVADSVLKPFILWMRLWWSERGRRGLGGQLCPSITDLPPPLHLSHPLSLTLSLPPLSLCISSLFQAVEFTFFTKSGTLKEQLTRANSSTNCLQIECWIKGWV